MSHTILIVDDEANQRMLYASTFRDEGYEVLEASDGIEAIEKVRTRSPDLVVLDISMPGMDGIETLGKILSRESKIPVVINTAYGRYKDNFMSWSADAYVVKSADLTELKRSVHELLDA